MVNGSFARRIAGQVNIGAIVHTGTTTGNDHDPSTLISSFSSLANVHVAGSSE